MSKNLKITILQRPAVPPLPKENNYNVYRNNTTVRYDDIIKVSHQRRKNNTMYDAIFVIIYSIENCIQQSFHIQDKLFGGN